MNDNTQENVVVLNMETRKSIPPDRVLSGALGKLNQCVVVGWTEDGELYCASSTASKGDIPLLLGHANAQTLA